MDERKTVDFNSAAAENQIISEFEEFQQRAHLSQINAVPLRDNIYEWHFNLFPKGKKGRALNACIHGALKFDRNPRIPPIIEILSPQFQHSKIVALNGHYHVNILEDGEKDFHMSPTDILRRLAKLFERQKFQKQVEIPHCICGHDSQNTYPSKDKTYVFQHVVAAAALTQQNVDVSNKANQFKDCMIKSVLVDYGKVYYKALIRDMKFDTATPVRLGWGFPPDNLEDWEKQEFFGCLFGTRIDESPGGYFLHKEPWKIGWNLPLQTGFTSGDIVTVGVDFENSKFLFAVNDVFIGESQFPDFMKCGTGFYPVAGVLQSSIQMIFHGPPPEVELDRFDGFMSVREYLQSDRGAYWWKHGVQYHWIDFFDHGLSYEEDASQDYLEAEVLRVFEYLSAPDLRRACEVAVTFREVINRSTLLQQANLFCYYTRKRYSDPGTVLGLMLDVRKPKSERRDVSFSIVSLTASVDYLSMQSWETGRIRHDSSSARREYTHFLPVILNDDHGPRAFEQLPKYIGEILGKSGDATITECFDGLAALMNGCIQTLANGFDSSHAPSFQLQDETLRLFAQLYHLMLYLASKHPQVVEHASQRCNDFSKAAESGDDAVPPLNQLGMMIASLFVLTDLDITWHSIRRQYVNEIWARDVSTYLKKKRDLENPGYPMEKRVKDVWDATKTSKRTFHTLLFSFFAVHFRGNANLMENFGSKFGSPPSTWHGQLRTQCENICENMHTWIDYFKLMSCGHPPQQTFGPMLYNAVQMALRRGYVDSTARARSGGMPQMVYPTGQRQRQGQGQGQQNGYGPRGRGMLRGPRGRGMSRMSPRSVRGTPRGMRGSGRGLRGRGDRDYERREMPARQTDPSGRFGRPDDTAFPRGRRGDSRRGGGVGRRNPTRGSGRPARSGRFGALDALSSVIFPAKPLATVESFPEVFRKSLEQANIRKFSEYQQGALRVLTNGGSVQVVSPVGTGKATTVGIAALYRLFCQENAIVIVLCADNIRVATVSELFDGLKFEFPRIRVIQQCKGSRFIRPNEIHSGRSIIVGTNGRMCDMMTRDIIGDTVKQRLVGVFVLDADFTLHSSQIKRTTEVFKEIHASIPCSIFSNSWCTPLDGAAMRVKGEMDYTPIVIAPKVQPKYWFVSCDNPTHRFELFCDLIEQNPLQKCVVFCNQQRQMDSIVEVIASRVRSKTALECTLENAKERAAKVAAGRADVLVSTDYGSPAISKAGCRVVINFEISTRDYETFTKRIGLIAPSSDGPIHVINLILSTSVSHEYWQNLERELDVSLAELEENLHVSLA